MLRYETYTRRHCSVRLSLIPGRRNVVLFEVYYCALPFNNLTSLVRLVAEDCYKTLLFLLENGFKFIRSLDKHVLVSDS